MGLEREQMKVKLVNLKHRERELTGTIENLASTIRYNLNTTLHKLRDLKVPEAASQMDDFQLAWAEYLSVQSTIERLEKELE